MMRSAARFFLILLLASPAAGQAPPAPPPPDPPCTYHLVYAADGAPQVQVGLHCRNLPPGKHTFVMPRAIPMGYGERPYDKYVRNVRAFGASGDPFKVEREQGPRWRLEPPAVSGAVLERIEYEVDLAEMERDILDASDTSKVRPGYAGILGYSVFGYIEGQEAQAVRLEASAPEGWPVFLTLEPQAPAAAGAARALGDDFYALADSQILLGPNFTLRGTDAGMPFYVAIYGEGPADVFRVTTEAEVIMERVADYFGSAPFPYYTVHIELLKPVSPQHRYFFSMEHLNSSTFYLGHEDGLRAASPPAEAARFRYNLAHHFAHAWIPKRAYGEGYFPHLWETAPVLDTVWFSEGFAQYAAIDVLADAEYAEAEVYRGRMVQRRFRSTFSEVPPYMLRLPLMELSRIASTRYSEDFRIARACFSRGGLMALEMDQHIRAASEGKKRLRDALRHLLRWSAREKRGFRIEELPAIFEEATGVNTRPILEKWLAPYTPSQ
jgi:predicted metalloprotease with PDZ domain